MSTSLSGGQVQVEVIFQGWPPTPLMALTTSRAKTTLAPNQQYDSLARWVLDKRLWTLSWSTGLGVLVATSLLAIFTQWSITLSALITVPVFSFLMCLSSILPLVLLRRWDLQSTYVPAPSYSAQLSNVARKPATYRTIGIAAASFASYALLNCLCAASLGAHSWHLFMPTKRHALNLNENVLVLMAGNALVGAALAAKDVLFSRAVVKWQSKISMRGMLDSNAALYFTIGTPIRIAFSVTTAFQLTVWLFRKSFYRTLMRLPLLGLFVKPFIVQAARPSTSLPILGVLTLRLLALSILSALHYEVTQALFDSLTGRGMLIARDSPDPDACLRSGIEAKDEYYAHFAYLELAYVARKGPSSRRAPVFADPSKWQFMSRSCLRLLGEHYGHLKRRGKPPPPPAAAPAPAPPPASTGFGNSHFGSSIQTPRKQTTLVPNLNSSVYKPVPPPSPGAMFLKSLLSSSTVSPTLTPSSGPATPPVADNALANGARSPLKGSAMPSVFVMKAPEERTQNTIDSVGTSAPAVAPAPLTTSLFGLVRKGLVFVIVQITARVPVPSGRDGEPFIKTPKILLLLKRFLEVERTGRKVQALLAGREMDVLCVQILTGFTVASLKEDAYGTLQQDIPKILEALVKMLLALEDYHRELQNAGTTREELWEAELAIQEFILPFVEDITTALKDIMVTFGDRLNVFRLPLPVARRLQRMSE